MEPNGNRFKVRKVGTFAKQNAGPNSITISNGDTNAGSNSNATEDDSGRHSGITLRAYNLMRKASRKLSRSDVDQRKFSFAALTREALPRLDNYRISKRSKKRPSLGEIHGEAIDMPVSSAQDPEVPDSAQSNVKLGWVNGVVIPVILNIWGVMLFLRLSWVVAQSGIGLSLIIIGISCLVCVITTLSLSAICTNGEVKSGGVYFIISRSLGPEFGAAVGVVFAFANAVAASMNTIGFCSSLNDLLASYDVKIIDGGNNDIRIVGVITIIILICICSVGMVWVDKAQNILLIIITLAIFNFLIGAGIGPRDNAESIAKGFVGFKTDIFAENFGSDFRFSEGLQQDFFSVFAIFFPSVTGIQAGANISGDLKDPARAIPQGTMIALFISMMSYVIFVIFAGGAAVRDASGNVTDIINGTIIGSQLDCRLTETCKYGLQNSYSVMQLMSLWGPLIYAGCFAATLSTALTNLLSVPRLVQALGVDKIYPGLIFFSKPYGKHGEPYRGYVLTFFISAAFILIAELNLIAPLISNFYLASYALINFCTFHAAFVKPLGWRPTFKYYNAWLSLAGFFICVVIMFLIEWKSSLVTFAVIIALYLIVVYRKPDVNWGSTTQAQTYNTALSSAQKLQAVSDHVKNYRPQVLVLVGDPKARPPLLDLANLITKKSSLMIVGQIVQNPISNKTRANLLKEGQKYLRARKIKAFHTVIDGFSFEDGTNALIKASGFGKMCPNIVMMGYKNDWRTCPKEELAAYFNVLHLSFASRMAVAILRLPEGLDLSSVNQDIVLNINSEAYQDTDVSAYHKNKVNGNPSLQIPKTSEIFHVDSNLNLHGMVTNPSTPDIDNDPHADPNHLSPPILYSKNDSHQLTHHSNISSTTSLNDIVYSTKGGSEVPRSLLNALTYFTRKHTKPIIDIWWLYDDGGLTMLLPYIISTRSTWVNCQLRVFSLSNPKLELEVDEKNVASLLHKLRIEYKSLTMLQGIFDRPKQSSIDAHEQFLENFQESRDDIYVSESEKSSLQDKTFRQLRLHEMLQEHSKDASLIFMSLPMPRQEVVTAPLYMSWLEILTKDISCPLVLVRGNHTPVLTFYS